MWNGVHSQLFRTREPKIQRYVFANVVSLLSCANVLNVLKSQIFGQNVLRVKHCTKPLIMFVQTISVAFGVVLLEYSLMMPQLIRLNDRLMWHINVDTRYATSLSSEMRYCHPRATLHCNLLYLQILNGSLEYLIRIWSVRSFSFCHSLYFHVYQLNFVKNWPL